MCIALPSNDDSQRRRHTFTQFYEQLGCSSLSSSDEPEPDDDSCLNSDFRDEATIISLQLLLHQTAQERTWRHESIVLTISYRSQLYFVHIDRSWSPRPGGKQRARPTDKGEYNPAQDDIVFYLPGDDERNSSAVIVAEVNFQADNADATAKLKTAADILSTMTSAYPQYSSLGHNCWAWSRYFMILFVGRHRPAVQDVQLHSEKGSSGVEELMMFLKSNGPWEDQAIVGLAYMVRQMPSFLRKFELAMSAKKGQSQYLNKEPWSRDSTGDSATEARRYTAASCISFYRNKLVELTPSQTLDHDNNMEDCTNTGIPHFFDSLGHARDAPAIQPNSLSCAGEFLYLLTSPIHLPDRHHVSSISILASVTHRNDSPGEHDAPETGGAWGLMTWALVRKDAPGGQFRVVGQRVPVPVDSVWGADSLYWDLSYEGPIVNCLLDGDMIAVWASGPPTASDEPNGPSMLVSSAMLKISLKEALMTEDPDLPLYMSNGFPVEKIESGWSGGMQISTQAKLPGSREVQIFAQTTSLTVNARQGQAPHHNPLSTVGSSNQPNISPHSDSLSTPGCLLYVMTNALDLKPGHAVRSIDVETWSYEKGRRDLPDNGTYKNSCTSFEAGIIRATGDGETPEAVGQRYQICQNLHAKSDQYYHHSSCLDEDHALVRQLEDGDMIGIWAIATVPGWANHVEKAFIGVDIDRSREIPSSKVSTTWQSRKAPAPLPWNNSDLGAPKSSKALIPRAAQRVAWPSSVWLNGLVYVAGAGLLIHRAVKVLQRYDVV